jgi:hypothetical protein
VRIRALNHLTIQLKYQAQYAMGCWMLRPKVQGVIFNFGHD